MAKMLTPGSKFGSYQIEEVIGSGAMGVVYEAIDTKLERQVALKLIDDSLSQSQEYRARLAQEAKAAAKIDSPYVIKVWEYAEFEGQPYIALEYAAGEELRTAADCANYHQKLEIARQIGEGLASAHSCGLVHRDLKPENIKVTRDAKAKILDFGLAKTIHADSVNRHGDIEGTLYYLSPEQITGEPVTFKSDIFSYGILLYELFTGKRPFDGNYPAAIIYSILHEDPSPPSTIRQDLPPWLDELVLRLMAKKPDDRFESMIAALEFMATGKSTIRPIAPPRSRRTVTIIDLKNLSEDENWEYFCIGFTDDLIRELSRRTDIVVTAEPSTSYTRNVRDIFQLCRSDYVIVGSLMKWQNQIRLHLCVYGNEGANMLFADNYEVSSNEIFSMLSAAARDISAKFFEITGINSYNIEDPFRTDIAAYDHYLRGRNYYHTNRVEDLQIARSMFERAIEIDPLLAQAYSGLSDVFVTRYMSYYDRNLDNMELARKSAEKAIEIHPTLPEAHRSLGRYYMALCEYKRAEASFLRAVELDPKYAMGYRTLAWLNEITDNQDKAIDWAKLSLRYAPNDVETLLLLSLISIDQRKYTIAMATLQRTIDLAPDCGRAYYNLGEVYLKLGVIELALENFHCARKYGGDPNASIDAGYCHILRKEYQQAGVMFKESLNQGYFPHTALYYLGYVEAVNGDNVSAKNYYLQALKIAQERELKDRDNPHIIVYQALSLAALGNSYDAVAILEKLEEKWRENGAILYNLARGYAILGQGEKVKALLKRALIEHAGPTLKELLLDPHFINLIPVIGDINSQS